MSFETSKVNQFKDQLARGSQTLAALVQTHGPVVRQRTMDLVRKIKEQYDRGFGKPTMVGQTHSIAETQQKNTQMQVRDWLGKGASKLVSGREQDLLDFPKNHPDGYLDRIILFHLKQRAIAENDQNFLEGLHQNYWAELAHLDSFLENEKNFFEFVCAEQTQELEILNHLAQSCEHVVDLGCGSGKMTEYVKNNFGPFQSVSGVDINMRRILEQAPPVDPEIRFFQADGLNWLEKSAQPHSLFLTNGGVLEGQSRASVNALLQLIQADSKPAVFFANEPIASDHNFTTCKDSVPFGDELTFSHNYTDVFESNGFKIAHQRSVVFNSWKILSTIAVAL